jgi:hypothetical protein
MRRDRKSRPKQAAVSAPTRKSWPDGATAGLALVAAACIALSLTLYQLAGPRDVFADDIQFEPR